MAISIPNQLTLGRLVLAVVFFALLSCFDPLKLDQQRWLLMVCFWVFLAAAITDVLDGLLARLLRSVTSFGRILDPAVDKVMVCGAFVLFSSQHFWDGHQNLTGVQPWMVVVIVMRELLVSAVRSHSEGEGREFAANWAGKLKMFVQSATVCAILCQLAWNLGALEPVRIGAVWLTVVVTAASAISYVHRARGLLLTRTALSGEPANNATAPKPPTSPGSSG